MKFDHDLARTLLLEIESEIQGRFDEMLFGTEEDYVKYYHVKKLREAGYILADDTPSSDDEHHL